MNPIFRDPTTGNTLETIELVDADSGKRFENLTANRAMGNLRYENLTLDTDLYELTMLAGYGLVGKKDQIVPRRAVLDVFGQLAGAVDVIEYSRGWHLLFRDLQAERVWQDVAAWVPRAHTGAKPRTCRGTG